MSSGNQPESHCVFIMWTLNFICFKQVELLSHFLSQETWKKHLIWADGLGEIAGRSWGDSPTAGSGEEVANDTGEEVDLNADGTGEEVEQNVGDTGEEFQQNVENTGVERRLS